MFDRCFQDRKYKQALGIALETRRLDKIEQSITSAQSENEIQDMLQYAQRITMNLVLHREFRQTVLRLLVKLYTSHPANTNNNNRNQPDYLKICEICIHLDDSKMVSDILNKLIQSKDDVSRSY